MVKKLLVGLCVVILHALPAFAADLTPNIAVTPSTTVEVGQIVVFNAEGTTYTPNQLLVRRGRHEWDFGDGYTFKNPGMAPYTGLRPNGIAVAHYFMTPGTYTVTLTTKIWSMFSTYPCVSPGGTPCGLDVTPDASGTATVEITVTGKAPLSGFMIESAPFNNRSKQYVYITVPAAYRGGSTQLKLSLIGATTGTTVLEQKSNLASEESYLFDHTVLAEDTYVLQAELLDASNNRITSGATEAVWREHFSRGAANPVTMIDENNNYWHNGTLVFPIYPFMIATSSSEVNLWSQVANAWHTIDSGTSSDYYNTYITNMEARNPSLLAEGPGNGSYKYLRIKPNYLLSGITEYINVSKSKTSSFITCLQDEPNLGSSWEKALVPTLAAWEYTANVVDPDHPVQAGYTGQDWLLSTAVGAFDYQGSAVLMGGKKWIPSTFGYDVYASTDLRFATALNKADFGPWYGYLYNRDRMRSYASRTSQIVSLDYKNYRELVPMTAAIKPTATGSFFSVSSDSHTIQTGTHTFNIGTYKTILPNTEINASCADIPLDVTKVMTHRMHGTVTAYDPATGIVTANMTSIDGSGSCTTWSLSSEYPNQVAGETTYMSWLEVVHGAKGILWFQNYNRPAMQFSEMKTFKEQIEVLWPYISGPVPTTTITDDQNDKLSRVDTMIRESGDALYIVAVRITEPPPEPSVAWVRLTGTPSTVISNGKVQDSNGKLWSFIGDVTIGEDGTAMAVVRADDYGEVVYVPYGMTTIYTPTEGWDTVENAYSYKAEKTGYSYTMPTSATYNAGTTWKINVGAGLNWPATSDNNGVARYVRIAVNDSAESRRTKYIWGNYSKYDNATGDMTFILTGWNYTYSGQTFTDWVIETEWYQQKYAGSKYTGVEPESITPTFTISGLAGSTTINVVDEGRTLTATNGVFQDDFAKNAVHIYSIGGITSTTGEEPPADVTRPEISSFFIPSSSDSLIVPITKFEASDNVGVSRYCIVEINSSTGCTWTIAAPASYEFTTDGAKTLYAFVKDAAGNVSLSNSNTTDSVTITLADITSPDVDEFIMPATYAGLNVPVTLLKCTDAVGVTGYCMNESNDSGECSDAWYSEAPSQYSFDTLGSKTLYAFCKDAAGNISESAEEGVVVTVTQYQLLIGKLGYGSGAIYYGNGILENNTGYFDDGETVDLYGVADACSSGPVFTGETCTGARTCSVLISEEREVTATFERYGCGSVDAGGGVGFGSGGGVGIGY